MATNDTIEIKLIVRDEMSRVLDDAFTKMRRHDSGFSTGKMRNELDLLRRGFQFVTREIGAISRLTGIAGILGAGGLVAGIAAATKALGDFSRERLNLHYTAQALGTTSETMQKFTDALTALGKTQGEAASGIESAMTALRDLQTFGSKSSVWQELGKGVRGTGDALRRELVNMLHGPEGIEGALKLLFKRMQGMNPEAQRSISKMFNLGGVNARDIAEILPLLNKRVMLGVDDAKKLVLAQTNLQISMGNISTTLASALMPALTRLITSLDKWLQSDAGKKFVDQIKQWGKELTDAVDKWIAEGGLDRLADSLKVAVDELKKGFAAADKVIQDMGLSWPKAIGMVLLLPFAAWLLRVAAALTMLARYSGLLALVARLSPLALLALAGVWLRGATGGDEALEELKEKNRKQLENLGKPGYWGQELTPEQRENLKNIPWLRPRSEQPQPQSGEGGPKTESERRADLDADRSSKRALTDEFKGLSYSLAKLNDYLMPGGPEGGGGASGYSGADLLGGLRDFILGPAGGGKANRPLPTLPFMATALSAIPGTQRPVQTSGLGFASWYGNRPDLGFRDPEDKGRQGVSERDQGIALGPLSTLGQYHYITDPNTGLTHVTRQTDTGPNIRTQKLFDIHASQLARMGYTAKTFPSGKGLWGVQPAGFGQKGQEAAWAGRSGAFDEGGNIDAVLGGGSGSLGSANVDIDIGGAGGNGGARKSPLFNPVPTAVPVQMQPSGADTVDPSPFRFQ